MDCPMSDSSSLKARLRLPDAAEHPVAGLLQAVAADVAVALQVVQRLAEPPLVDAALVRLAVEHLAHRVAVDRRPIRMLPN
jgi:hypothetical protein